MDSAISSPEWVGRYNRSHAAGRKWAIEQIHEGRGQISLDAVRATAAAASIAFVAIQTGRLPTSAARLLDLHLLDSALADGFAAGVEDALLKAAD